LEGIHYEIQATDPEEMDLEVIRERANWTHTLLRLYKGSSFIPASECFLLH
jgi:hypothetical protein